ncbi:hypothetical protein ACFL5V_02990 [Fibrobacterota bacterium]
MSMPRRQINVSKWQDYRGKGDGILVYINSSSKSHWPVRDVINEYKKGFQADPSYETGTYNFLTCSNSKLGVSAYKNRRSYFLFGTSYQGPTEEYRGKYLIIGYMRIDKVLDVRKRHVHKWMEQGEESESPTCVDLQECYGFYSDHMNFYDLGDCFELNEEVMKGWGYKGRVAKHMKLTLSVENTKTILDHFASKTPKNDEYMQAVESLNAKKEEFLAEQKRLEQEEEDEW